MRPANDPAPKVAAAAIVLVFILALAWIAGTTAGGEVLRTARESEARAAAVNEPKGFTLGYGCTTDTDCAEKFGGDGKP